MSKQFELVSPASTEAFFSWRSCDLCQSGLGGDRYDIEAYETLEEAQTDKVNNKYELEVCVDCYMRLFS